MMIATLQSGRDKHVPPTNASEGHVRRARGEAIHDPTLQSARGKRIPPKAGASGLNPSPRRPPVKVRIPVGSRKAELGQARNGL